MLRSGRDLAPARVVEPRVPAAPVSPVPGSARPWRRWLPLAAAGGFVAAVLLVTGTPVVDLLKYVAYGVLAVILPGTLVYRALRRAPHTLVEDLAMGTAVGLALELAGWALFSALDLRAVMWLWPLLVLVPFAAVPALRRHWWVRGYTLVPAGFAWTLAGTVVFSTGYLWQVFFSQNPILPARESTRQWVDLAYLLALAGEAKHRLPPDVPQVAGEPLGYHWFAFVHMAMTSLVGHLDLPVVAMRLMLPALCALAAVLIGTAGWRLSGRPWVGAAAAVLFFAIGEFAFTDPFLRPFNTQVVMLVWASWSMTYSWPLLAALAAAVGDRLGAAGGTLRVPPIGPGAYVVAALLALAGSAAKASSLPVALAGVALAGLVGLVARRRIPWTTVALAAIVVAAQLFALAVVYRFQTYSMRISLFENVRSLMPAGHPGPAWAHPLTLAGLVVAWAVNTQLKMAGVVPLLWLERRRPDDVRWFVLGGALAGPAAFLVFGGFSATYFVSAGAVFGVIASAWGYALVVEKVGLSARARAVHAAGALAFAVIFTAVTVRFAPAVPPRPWSAAVYPILITFGALAAIAAVGWLAARRWLRGRYAVIVLTGCLVAGAPAFVLDAKQFARQGDRTFYGVPMPHTWVEAARWVRDHSDPDDVLATNAHCSSAVPVDANGRCTAGRGAQAFWLSAYSERSVLVEGWAFAPRVVRRHTTAPFWDVDLLRLNDDTVYAPTGDTVATMRDRHHVRYVVVDRRVRPESPLLADFATLRFSNARTAVYEIAG